MAAPQLRRPARGRRQEGRGDRVPDGPFESRDFDYQLTTSGRGAAFVSGIGHKR
jgi:hypothetical protein